MSIDLLEKIIVILINLTGFWMAYWVWSDNKKEKLNQWFALMTFFVILWVDFALLANKTENGSLSTLFYRLNDGCVNLFLISAFYFYVIYFLKKEYPILRKIVFVFGISLFSLSLFTGFTTKGTTLKSWGWEAILGPGNILFYSYSMIVALIVVGLLIREFFRFEKERKLKILYFLIGTFLFVSFNAVFNIVVPMVSNSIKYQYLGDYSAVFLLGFTAYAVVKRQLFGVKIILTKILIGAITILLLFNVADSSTLFEYIWRSALFMAFLFFGYLLVRSINRDLVKQKQLEKLTGKLARANRKLEMLDKAKSEFISIASHQLRTPLGAVKGFSSMLIEGSYGEISGEVKEVLKKISISNQRLITLVNDLLNLSRIESGKMQYDFKYWQIEDIVKEMADMLLLKVKEKGLYLKVNVPSRLLPKIKIDNEKIKEVISNLIENAIKYTAKGGINIDFEQSGNSVRIIISDTGVGISQSEMFIIFSKFSRGKNMNRLDANGAGLGLFVAKKITKDHGGKIWAESKGKDKGSKFFLELPIDIGRIREEEERQKMQKEEVEKFVREI